MANFLRRYISTRTPKFYFLDKVMGNKPFKLLDAGCGNHSPSRTKNIFPNCEYYGLDLNKDYAYNEADEKALKQFYQMDLTKLEFDVLPDNFFDVIILNHVIEHLFNGDMVIEQLSKKLNATGYFYIEYPSQKSTTLPSKPGTLNFYDDDTHVRIYSVKELDALMEKIGFKVISSGVRKSTFHIVMMPYNLLKAKLQGNKYTGAMYWDLLGFAEYVFAQRAR